MYEGLDSIRDWVRKTVAPCCEECWLFGSILTSAVCNDVDILVIISHTQKDAVLALSHTWRTDFEEKFGLPLHLNRLLRSEATEMSEWLQPRVYSSGYLVTDREV